jgi:hypothetical protein
MAVVSKKSVEVKAVAEAEEATTRSHMMVGSERQLPQEVF